MKKRLALALGAIVVIPIIIGIIVSIPGVSWLETSNDWIGFWGSYIGAIIGGLMTLLVLSATIKDSHQTQEKIRRQELAARVANLVSNFCIEMMAYRSKWNTLYKEAAGKGIDSIKKIEIGATTEAPRRIYFELDILLKGIPEAKVLLTEIKDVLECTITQKTVKETEELMDSIREQMRKFIDEYSLQ